MARATNRSAVIQKITLEDYQNFLYNPCFKEAMKNDHLNQIIQMNGFIKLHRHRKGELLEALSKIDVMKPQRSTLHDETISPYGSSLTVEQVNDDLDTLEWQECPVQSVKSLTDDRHFPHTALTATNGEENNKITVTTKPRSKRVRKRIRSVNEVVYGGFSGVVVAAAIDEAVDGDVVAVSAIDEAVNGDVVAVSAIDEAVNDGSGDVVAVAAIDDDEVVDGGRSGDEIFADLLPLWYPS